MLGLVEFRWGGMGEWNEKGSNQSIFSPGKIAGIYLAVHVCWACMGRVSTSLAQAAAAVHRQGAVAGFLIGTNAIWRFPSSFLRIKMRALSSPHFFCFSFRHSLVLNKPGKSERDGISLVYSLLLK